MKTLRTLFNRPTSHHAKSNGPKRRRNWAPRLEPLEERHLLSVSSLLDAGPTESSISVPNVPTDLALSIAGTTGPVRLGFIVEAYNSGFDPALPLFFHDDAARTPVAPTVLRHMNKDFQGTSSLVILDLAPGNYVVQVGGELGTTGAFRADVFLPGDINGDHQVDYNERLRVEAAAVQASGSWNLNTAQIFAKAGINLNEPQFRSQMDADRNGVFSDFDLFAATFNYNKGTVLVQLVADQDPPAIAVAPAAGVTWNTVDDTLFASSPNVTITISDESKIETFKIALQGSQVGYVDFFSRITPAGGTVTLTAADFTALGMPSNGQGGFASGAYSLLFLARDEHDNEYTVAAPFKFDYTVITNNQAPTAVNDQFSADEKTGTSGQNNVLTNDTDPNFPLDILKVTGYSGVNPAWGSVAITPNGDLSFTPSDYFRYLGAGESAPITFHYSIRDALGLTSSAQITITVQGVNDAPFAKNASFPLGENVSEDGPAVAIGSVVLNNFDDYDTSDKGNLQIVSITPMTGAKGVIDPATWTFSPNGQFEYLAEGEQETVSFLVTVRDPGGLTATATLNITIVGENDAPTANDDTIDRDAQNQPIVTEDSVDVDLTSLLLANDTDPDTNDILRIVDVTQPTQGSVSLNNGVLKFTAGESFQDLNVGQTREVTFTYTISDRATGGLMSTATVTVVVHGLNDAPTAISPTVSPTPVSEDSAGEDVTLLLENNFTDIDNGAVLTIDSVQPVAGQAKGIVVLENGSWIYKPNGQHDSLLPGQTATDRFTVTVRDEHGATATAELVVTITGENDPVTINPGQTLTVASVSDDNAPLTIGTVAISDLDVGDTYVFEIVGREASHPDDTDASVFSIDNLGRITVPVGSLPNHDFEYTFTLTIKVTDLAHLVDNGVPHPDTTTDTRDVTIRVIPNQPPVIENPDVTAHEKNGVVITASELLGSATDPEDDPLQLTFTPGTYTTATGATYVVASDGSISYNPGTIFQHVAQGVITGVVDEIPFQVSDDKGNTTSGVVQIRIQGVNDAPVAVSPTIVAPPISEKSDAPVNITNLLLNNFTDVDDGAVLTIHSVAAVSAANGTVTQQGGQWFYTPNGRNDHLLEGQTLTDTFTVTARDEHGATATAGLTVTIVGENDPVTINPGQTFTVASVSDDNAPLTIGPVAISDLDVGDTYVFEIVGRAASHPDDTDASVFAIDNLGRITVPAGSLPNHDFEYTFSLTIKVTDQGGAGTTDTRDVTIRVTPNQPPVIVDPEVTAHEKSGVVITAAQLLASATDPENDPLSLVFTPGSYTTVAGATYTVAANGAITYNPGTVFQHVAQGVITGVVDQIPFQVSDDKGNTTSGAVQIRIQGVNDAPTAVQATFALAEPVLEKSTGIDITALILANFVDVDQPVGVPLTIHSVTPNAGAKGTVVKQGEQWIYRPNGQYNYLAKDQLANESFTVTVRDVHNASATATLNVTIKGENDAPVAVNDSATTPKNQPVTFNVLANDYDPDTADGAPAVVSFTTPAKGTVTRDGGLFTFNPNGQFNHLAPGQSESVTFNYTIQDIHGAQATATVTVTVTGANLAPVTTNFTVSVDADATTMVDLGVNNRVTDPEGNPWTLVSVTASDGNSDVTVTRNGRQITFDPHDAAFLYLKAGETVTRTFTYTVNDNSPVDPKTATGTITLTIVGKNDAPRFLPGKEAQLDALVAAKLPVRPTDTLLTGSYDPVLSNLIYDPDGDTIVYTATISNTDLVVLVNSSGQELTPGAGGVYTLTDGQFRLKAKGYDVLQDWTPAIVTLTASDGTASFTKTLTLAPELQTSFDVMLRVVDDPQFIGGTNGNSSTTKPVSASSVSGNYYVEFWVKDNLPSQYFTDPNQLEIFSISSTIAWGGGGGVSDASATFSQLGGSTIVKNFGGKMIENFGAFMFDGFGTAFGRDSYYRVGYLYVTPSGTSSSANPTEFWIEMPTANADFHDIVSRNTTSLEMAPSQHLLVGNRVSEKVSFTVTSLSGLHAAEAGQAALQPGVYMTVTKSPTPTSADSSVQNLPDSVRWLDEWTTHYVELWANATELDTVDGAQIALRYNGAFFTATGVEYGPGIAAASDAVIDDADGLVRIDAKAVSGAMRKDGLVLLGRVKFESLEGDNVPIGDFNSPYALGLRLDVTQFHTPEGDAMEVHRGAAPTVDLWAVPYDMNEDGKIGREDYIHFVRAYGKTISPDSPMFAAMDYNKSGSIDRSDYLFFVSNYGVTKYSPRGVRFPETFVQKWVGTSLNVTGDATLDQLLEAANAQWQRTLGLDKPIDVRLFVIDTQSNLIGTSEIIRLDAKGFPAAAVITIDNDAAGAGWYASLSGDVPEGKYDLYTTLLHELGHAYGFTTAYAGFDAMIARSDEGSFLVGPNFRYALDETEEHFVDSSTLMAAELEPGLRKSITKQDRLAVLWSMHMTTQGYVGLNTSTAALHAAFSAQPSVAVAPPQSGVVIASTDSRSDVAFHPVAPSFRTKIDDLIRPDGAVSSALYEEWMRSGIAVSIPMDTARLRAEQVRETVWSDWTSSERQEDESEDMRGAFFEGVDQWMTVMADEENLFDNASS